MSAAAPPSPLTARILIVDDSHLVRAGLRAVLECAPGPHTLTICGEAGTATEAMEMVRAHQPDIVLMDIRLPDGYGYAVCRDIVAQFPDIRVLMLTAFTNDNFIYESITAGAHGYLMKEADPEQLFAAIEDVLAGKSALPESINTKMSHMTRQGGPDASAALLKTLSAQETRVLALVAEGRTNHEVAAKLNLSDNTVKNYLASVFVKLKIRRRSQAATIWTRCHPPKD